MCRALSVSHVPAGELKLSRCVHSGENYHGSLATLLIKTKYNEKLLKCCLLKDMPLDSYKSQINKLIFIIFLYLYFFIIPTNLQ